MPDHYEPAASTELKALSKDLLLALVASVALLTGCGSDTQSQAETTADDFQGKERAFIEEVAQFDLTLDQQAQIDLANDVCDSIQSRYENNTGNNFAEAKRVVPQQTGLVALDALRYTNTITKHFCPRFYNPNQR